MTQMCNHEYCDDCGCRVYPKARCVVESLPCDIASANEGESATLCRRCYGIVTGQDAPVPDDNTNPCRCCGEIVYDTDYDTCELCEPNDHTPQGMERMWGKKCKRFKKGCGGCEAWRLYEQTGRVPAANDVP
jgi:hypothetical protein